LSDIQGNSTIGDILSIPNASYPYYWAWIFFGIWVIILLTSYFTEKTKKGTANILSSMAVACFAILPLATIGTVVGFITLEIFIPMMVLCFLIIGIWFFSVRNS
jgi:hypothetical protein